MATDPVKDWLQKYIKTSIQVSLLGGFGCIAAGLFLLGAVFFVFYALSGILFSSEILRMIAAALGIGVTFLGNAIFGTPPAKPGAQGVPNIKDAQNQNVDSVQTMIRMAAAIIFCGPKAIAFGMTMLEKVKRLKRLDYDGCTLVLLLLLTRNSRVAFPEFKQRIPRLNADVVFEQLKDIEGILFLDSDPPGLTLSEALRTEISIFRR